MAGFHVLWALMWLDGILVAASAQVTNTGRQVLDARRPASVSVPVRQAGGTGVDV